MQPINHNSEVSTNLLATRFPGCWVIVLKSVIVSRAHYYLAHYFESLLKFIIAKDCY